MSRPTVIITGANGFVGSYLVKHFAKKNWQVRALVFGHHAKSKAKNVTYFAYSLGEEPDAKIFKNADYLIHLAYIKEDRKNPDARVRNINGTKLLLKKAREAKLRKIIFMSSMSAHKGATSGYAKQKLKLEKQFNARNEVVIRSGLVIGNGGLIKQIVSFMRSKHVAPLIDGGKQPLQVIAIYNLADVIENLLTKNLRGLFTVGTPRIYSYREFYDIIRRKLGIKVLLLPVPSSIPILVIRFASFLRLPMGFTTDNLEGLKKLKSFDTKQDLKKIGVELDELDKILDKIGSI